MKVREGDIGLPQMTEIEFLDKLLDENLDLGMEEPEIAAGIGEQMLHMDMKPLPRSVRARIRDVCSRIISKNVVLVGGGIGHLSAWLFDLWCDSRESRENSQIERPESFRIIEPGARFGVVIDRLIRRYDAESWASVIQKSWNEVIAEGSSENLSEIAVNEFAKTSILPMPINMIIIDMPEGERIQAVKGAFDIVTPGGIVLVQEPAVPAGDVGSPSQGERPTPAQSKVIAFNKWIELVKRVNEKHSIGFTELTGGTLVALIKKSD